MIDYGLEHYSCVQVNVSPGESGSYLLDEVPGKGVKMVKVQTEILTEPFCLLLKEGEKVTGNWYLEPAAAAEMGATVGAYRITVGDTVCGSFPIVIGSRQVWNGK